MLREKLDSCTMADGMDDMLKIFESDDLTEFFYYYNKDGCWGYKLL